MQAFAVACGMSECGGVCSAAGTGPLFELSFSPVQPGAREATVD